MKVSIKNRPITDLMTLLSADSLFTKTLAATQAAENLAANRNAIALTQPDVHIAELPPDVEWIFGRDRALTFRDAHGNWFLGCSLPRRAATEMMRRLDIAGNVACFLAPSHGAQLRVALDRLLSEQAIVAIFPNANDLPLLLACDNFAVALARHRLWLVAGADWARDLKRLLADVPGLCTPAQFIRLPIADDPTVDGLIPPAQKTFAEVNADRAAAIRTLRDSYIKQTNRLCVIAPAQFRLWDDAGAALADLLAPCDPIRIDLDKPSEASAFALACRAKECGAVVAANIGRSDLPGVLSDSIPWITWASDTRIPTAAGATHRDRLITANSKLALAAGWHVDQLIESAWPTIRINTKRDLTQQGHATARQPAPARSESWQSASWQSLAFIANTTSLDPPDHLTDFSSHRVLWELIAADLHSDPFTLTEEIDAFLTRQMRKLDVAPETLPVTQFVNDLILPAYQQGLARTLIRAKIPVRLFGNGWDRIPEFAPHACGAVQSREHLQEIAVEHAALVHIWPHTGPHAIDAFGRPVLRRRGSHGTGFINDARQLLTGRAMHPPFSTPALTCQTIQNLVR